MADKTASVRLDLKDSGFTTGFNKAKSGVEQGAKSMGASLKSSMNAGAKGGVDAVRGMFSTIKNAAMGLSGILGGIGFAGLVKNTIDAETKFRKLSFTMGAGKGAFEDYRTLQTKAGESALKWAQDQGQLADAVEQVFNTVGDADYATGTLDEIAKAARASGQEVSTIAPLVAEMNRQYGVTAAEVPDALARVLSLTARGALSAQDLGANMDKMGKLAKTAGLQGVDGMTKMIALVNEATPAGGRAEMTIERMNQVIVKLAGSTDKIKKDLGIDIKGMDSVKALQAVMQATKGDMGKLSGVFGEESGVFLQSAFGGIKNLDAFISESAKGSMDSAKLQERANENMKSSEAGITKALETLKQSFQKPEMQDAIGKLAENLPALAEAVAKAVEWITKNPITAAGVLGGGKFMSGALGVALQSAIQRGGTQAGNTIAGSMTTAGGGVATGLKNALGGIAGSAAIMALAAAIDQAVKLYGEVQELNKSSEDERKNLAGVAEMQGAPVERERTYLEKSRARDRGIGEFFSSGRISSDLEQPDDKEMVWTDSEGRTRTMGKSEFESREPAERVSFEAAGLDQERKRRGLKAMYEGRQFDYSDEEERGYMANYGPMPSAPAATTQQQQKGPVKVEGIDALRSAVQAGPTKTLDVRITNINELRVNTTGSGPTPGYAGGK